MSENSISPILFLGIGLFLVPVILGFIKVTAPRWFFSAGLVVIVIGAFHTMMMRRPK